ncbi:MAG TPA: hypothetical protein PLI99_01025 [archaeon]|nr:hypothetical protein [archaeon]
MNNSNSYFEQQVNNCYKQFFTEFKINEPNGYLKKYPNLKFATFPFIGSKYGKTKKILFIGLDVGSDEHKNRITSFEIRRLDIENKSLTKHNQHIAGTYITALKFLKKDLKLESYWDNIEKNNKFKSCQAVLKSQNSNYIPSQNLLSYIALTNYHKFVTIERENKSGGQDRKNLNKSVEENLLITEIKSLEPDQIIFQSKTFEKNYNLIELIKKETKIKEIYIGPHPSYHGNKNPKIFTNQIKKIEKVKEVLPSFTY